MVALINSVPPILAGLARPDRQRGHDGRLPAVQVRHVLPDHPQPVVRAGSVRHARSEMQRGSMEFLASSGLSRRKIALEKLSGHLTGLAIAFVVTLISIAIAGASFATLPGDEISLTQAFGYSIWMVLMALAAGGVAFALAPFIGRGAAAGIAGFITIAGFVLNGYSAAVPALAPLANLTWFGWTNAHLPLAGQFDWPSVAFLAVFDVVMLAIGVVAFGRRDIGVTSTVPTPRCRARWSVCVVRPPGNRSQPERRDRVGRRHRHLRPAAGGRVGQLHRHAQQLARLLEAAQDASSRTSTSPAWVASCSCCSSRSASC